MRYRYRSYSAVPVGDRSSLVQEPARHRQPVLYRPWSVPHTTFGFVSIKALHMESRAFGERRNLAGASGFEHLGRGKPGLDPVSTQSRVRGTGPRSGGTTIDWQ